MNRDIVELEERFQQLNRSRSALSAEMRDTATALRTSGNIPRAELEHSLGDYRELFGRFRAEMGITTQDSALASGTTWDVFQDRLTVFREASEAIHCVQRSDQLSLSSGVDSVLDPIRLACREVTARLAHSPWDESHLVREIREGHHPLCRLVSLVERLGDLTDDEWTTEMAVVQESFGTSVSTAIARGKVALISGDQT